MLQDRSHVASCGDDDGFLPDGLMIAGTCLVHGVRSISEFTCGATAHAPVIVYAQVPGRLEVLGDC